MLSNAFSKSVLLSAIAGFIVFSLYGFVVHGNLLQDLYAAQPAGLYRAEADSQPLMHWIFIAYALMAWVMAILRPAGVDTVAEGLQRGALLGVFLGAVNFILYAVQPMTFDAAVIVFIADVVMVALGGGIIAAVAGRS